MLILELSKIVKYEFWYDYVKPKYKEKATLWYMDIDIKTEDIYVDLAKYVGARSDRPLPQEKYKKVIGLMKDKLWGKTMKEFAAWRLKTYNNDEDKKSKLRKKCIIKKKTKI